MTRPLYILRPEPGWSETAHRAKEMGFKTRGAPLFAMEPIDWDVPEPGGFDGLLAGSANAFRLGGPNLPRLTKLPVLAVGQATAEVAREKGFTVEDVGSGGLQKLLEGLGGEGRRLLRLAGEAHVALAPPDGIEVETRVVYRAVPQILDERAASELADNAVVLLHSGEAAREFSRQCDALGVERGRIDLCAIGPRVAEIAGKGWQSIHTAGSPTDAALLALAKRLCQAS